MSTVGCDDHQQTNTQDHIQCVNETVLKQQLQAEIKQSIQQHRKNPDDNNEHKQDIDAMQSTTVINVQPIEMSESIQIKQEPMPCLELDPDDVQIKHEPVPYLEPLNTKSNPQTNQVPEAFLCAICDVIFASKEELHNDINHHIQTHYCLKCKRKYSRISSSSNQTNYASCQSCKFISDHCESMHPCVEYKSVPGSSRIFVQKKKQQKYPCPHCPKLLSSKNSLEVHTRTHTNERPFKCEFCDSSFSRKNSLQEHLNGHTGKKPFKCKYCDLAFSKSNQKCDHEKNEHIGWKCAHCNTIFERKHWLRKHRDEKHKNVKKKAHKHGQNWFKFECKGCLIRFKTKQQLDAHAAQCEKEEMRLNALKNSKNKNKRKRNDVMDELPKKKRKIVLTIKRRTKGSVDVQLNKIEKRKWSTNDCAQWIGSLGNSYRKYMRIFIDNGVDGMLLSQLDDEVLKEIVKSRIHLMKILSSWNQLQLQTK
eukprot:1136718_1